MLPIDNIILELQLFLRVHFVLLIRQRNLVVLFDQRLSLDEEG